MTIRLHLACPQRGEYLHSQWQNRFVVCQRGLQKARRTIERQQKGKMKTFRRSATQKSRRLVSPGSFGQRARSASTEIIVSVLDAGEFSSTILGDRSPGMHTLGIEFQALKRQVWRLTVGCLESKTGEKRISLERSCLNGAECVPD